MPAPESKQNDSEGWHTVTDDELKDIIDLSEDS